MILARLTRAIREQNWFAVILEFIIVVGGVLLAFQINAWSERRADTVAEQAFRDRLAAEISESEPLLERGATRRLTAFSDLTAAMALIDSDEAGALTDAQCFAILTSGDVLSGLVVLPSLVELAQSDRLGIITDDALRQAITVHLVQQESFQKFIDQTVYFVDMVITFPHLITVSSYINETGEVRLRGQCDLEAMRNDPAFRNALARNFDSQDSMLGTRLQPLLESRRQLALLVEPQGGQP